MNKLHRTTINLALSLPLAAALMLPATTSASTQDFTVPTFSADYTLSRDANHISHLVVHEHLVAQFPETDQNHGILRAIPAEYESRSLNLQIQSVTDASGHNLQVAKSNSNGNLVLRIGDPDTYVHGLQTYDISYTMDNVTTKHGDFDGFFWDVNGDQWQQTFGQVTATLHLASDIAGAALPNSARCYTGPSGSTAQACTVTPDGDGLTTFTVTRPLTAGETLTIETRFAADTFSAYRMPASQLQHLLAIIFGLYVTPITVTLLFALTMWRRHGRDPAGRGVIVPEYVPPKDMSLIASSVILNESFKPASLSAQILDLAVRRYIKIYEIKRSGLFANGSDYELELVGSPGDLRGDERATIDMLFGPNAATSTRVNLQSLKNALYKQATAVGDSVTSALVTDGSLQSDPGKAKIPYFGFGIVLIVVAFFALPNTIGIGVCGVILIITAQFMPARTAKGVAQREYLLGLKLYMTVAEADRIKTMQSPNGNLTEKIDFTDSAQLVKVYERLLPYAMLMGIEKDWAKQFAPLYQTPPDWYAGSGNFNVGYFAGSMASFGAASTSSFTAPASSGGGGSAGGGGGGGGGGGW